ncbi:MAG: SURF1 family protein [Minwuia sp.]|nr:SURF1 family protein [Minwuia sp.]
MRNFRPSFWLTAAWLPSLVFLLFLGTWQMDRRAWKLDLISDIDARMTQESVPLPERIEDPEAWRFRKVSVTGTFIHEAEAHRVSQPRQGTNGFQVLTPLLRDNGTAVIVDRGWIPKPLKDPASRADGQIAGPVTVTGIVRLKGEQTMFVPDNEPVANNWFFVDLAALETRAGVPLQQVYLVQTESPVAWPDAAPPSFSLRNNHLEYAFTWYSMAVIMTVIYILMGLTRGRERKAK